MTVEQIRARKLQNIIKQNGERQVTRWLKKKAAEARKEKRGY